MRAMELPIYFDYAATTPVDERVAEKMHACLTRKGVFGNPGSRTHAFGWAAAKLVEQAREEVAELVNCTPREIVWTSGATEANNLAIKGVAERYRNQNKHIITSKIEHKAVLGSCQYLEQQGFTVTYLDPGKTGVITAQQVVEALRPETILVSLMHVNNEIGTVNNIAEIAAVVKQQGQEIVFHVDAAQSAGKLAIDLQQLPVDLMSFSAHKIYGPKGAGALFVRRKPAVKLIPQMHGGKQEWGLRSGTMATQQIVGMGAAFAIAKAEMAAESERLFALKQQLWEGIKDLEETYLNGDLANGAPHILNVSFNYVEGESLLMATKDLAVSTGSACTSATLETSYVLKALGVKTELAHGAIRFSLGRYTTAEEIEHAIGLIRVKVPELRELSPLWEMYKKGVNMDAIEWEEHE